MLQETRVAAYLVLILVAMIVVSATDKNSTNWSTLRQDVGSPAGLVPRCPGVMKNATISPKMLNKLIIVHYSISNTGTIKRRMMPITSAGKLVANDKTVDLKDKKTLIYSSGFLDSTIFPHNQAIAREYSKQGYNIFMTETIAFLSLIYPKSARLTKPLGQKIGDFMVKLYKQGLQPEKLEIVGLSLGAQVLSHAAKRFYAKTGKKPARFTGLDPAGPCFRTLPPEYRFTASDAERVDVVHTNIDGFGMPNNLGHVDFYANGGEYQPGDIPNVPCLIICSHFRAVIYWWQALQHPKKFIGFKCDSVQNARLANCHNNSVINYFGLDTNFDRPGIYYLPIKNVFPYYTGLDSLKDENQINSSLITKANVKNVSEQEDASRSSSKQSLFSTV